MANFEEMDLTPIDQLDLELLLLLDLSPFSQDAGFSAPPPQPQAGQLQPEEFPTYDATVYSNELLLQNVGPDYLMWGLDRSSERQLTVLEPRDMAPILSDQRFQFDEAPARSSITTMLLANNTRQSITGASASSLSRNKRKLEEHVGCFSIYNNPAETRRKRQAFDPSRRKEVALMRKVKPCSRCKARRIKVSTKTYLVQAPI
jgi:hypothetical protein